MCMCVCVYIYICRYMYILFKKSIEKESYWRNFFSSFFFYILDIFPHLHTNLYLTLFNSIVLSQGALFDWVVCELRIGTEPMDWNTASPRSTCQHSGPVFPFPRVPLLTHFASDNPHQPPISLATHSFCSDTNIPCWAAHLWGHPLYPAGGSWQRTPAALLHRCSPYSSCSGAPTPCSGPLWLLSIGSGCLPAWLPPRNLRLNCSGTRREELIIFYISNNLDDFQMILLGLKVNIS